MSADIINGAARPIPVYVALACAAVAPV